MKSKLTKKIGLTYYFMQEDGQRFSLTCPASLNYIKGVWYDISKESIKAIYNKLNDINVKQPICK